MQQLIDKIIDNLTDDLRKKPWNGSKNKVAGHCYVASEAGYQEDITILYQKSLNFLKKKNVNMKKIIIILVG